MGESNDDPSPATTQPPPPPADTTQAPPPADTTQAPPPADTTQNYTPAATTTAPPPADTTQAPPPADTTQAPPPANTTQNSTPAATTTAQPSNQSTNPPPDSTTTAQPSNQQPAATTTQAAAPTNGASPRMTDVSVTVQPDDGADHHQNSIQVASDVVLTLNWSSENTVGVRIDPLGDFGPSGLQQISTADASYKLVALGDGGVEGTSWPLDVCVHDPGQVVSPHVDVNSGVAALVSCEALLNGVQCDEAAVGSTVTLQAVVSDGAEGVVINGSNAALSTQADGTQAGTVDVELATPMTGSFAVQVMKGGEVADSGVITITITGSQPQTSTTAQPAQTTTAQPQQTTTAQPAATTTALPASVQVELVLEADPEEAAPGADVTLKWEIKPEDAPGKLALDDGSTETDVTGQTQITRTLTAAAGEQQNFKIIHYDQSGNQDAEASASVNVVEEAQPTITLTLTNEDSGESCQAGGSVKTAEKKWVSLGWQVTGKYDELSFEPEIEGLSEPIPASGIQRIQIDGSDDITWTLKAGEASASVTAQVAEDQSAGTSLQLTLSHDFDVTGEEGIPLGEWATLKFSIGVNVSGTFNAEGDDANGTMQADATEGLSAEIGDKIDVSSLHLPGDPEFEVSAGTSIDDAEIKATLSFTTGWPFCDEIAAFVGFTAFEFEEKDGKKEVKVCQVTFGGTGHVQYPPEGEAEITLKNIPGKLLVEGELEAKGTVSPNWPELVVKLTECLAEKFGAEALAATLEIPAAVFFIEVEEAIIICDIIWNIVSDCVEYTELDDKVTKINDTFAQYYTGAVVTGIDDGGGLGDDKDFTQASQQGQQAGLRARGSMMQKFRNQQAVQDFIQKKTDDGMDSDAIDKAVTDAFEKQAKDKSDQIQSQVAGSHLNAARQKVWREYYAKNGSGYYDHAVRLFGRWWIGTEDIGELNVKCSGQSNESDRVPRDVWWSIPADMRKNFCDLLHTMDPWGDKPKTDPAGDAQYEKVKNWIISKKTKQPKSFGSSELIDAYPRASEYPYADGELHITPQQESNLDMEYADWAKGS